MPRWLVIAASYLVAAAVGFLAAFVAIVHFIDSIAEDYR